MGILDQNMQTEQPAPQDQAPPEKMAPGQEQKPGNPGAARALEFKSKAVEAVPANLQEAFKRVVLAGMKVMYSQEMQGEIQSEMKREAPMFQKLAEAVAGLMGVLVSQSKGMPPEVVMPAAVELIYEAASFVNESGMGKASPDDVKQAVQYLAVIMMKAGGMQEGQIQQVFAGAGQPAQPAQV